MNQSRRDILRRASALSALVVGASGTASAANCSGVSAWQSGVAYNGGDRVTHDGSLWKAKWWSKGTEPGSGGEWGPWTKVGACDGSGGGGGDDGDGSGNQSPMASFATDPASPNPGESITFDASGSSDSDGSITSYEWDFGDGSTATGQTVSHTYETAGDYTVTLIVTDDTGATATATTIVSVATDPEPPTDEFKVVGYYPGWKATPEYDYYPKDIPWDKVTDVLYAFLGVDAQNGVPTIMSELDQQNLDRFKELKSGPAADTRVKISIGGWADSTGFSEIAASASKRQSFAQRAVEIVREHNLDGVDIDWEHPGPNRGKCQCGSPDDPENHVKLLQALRDELDSYEAQDGQRYHLTVANGGSDWNAALIKHRAVEQVVDDIYMMTYDFTGVWQNTAGLNAPIYGTPPDYPPTGSAQQYTLETSLIIWKEQGYWVDWMQWEPYGQPVQDPSSLVLGIPFYGRGCLVDNEIWDTFNLPDWQQGNPKYQNDHIPPGTWNELLPADAANTGAFDFGDLEENYVGTDGWETNRNQQGQVPWLWNESQGIYISYDDADSVAEKVQFAKDENLGGVMIWELSHDWNETLLDTINANV
jgi:chitinase